MIQLQQLSFYRGERVILDKVDLTLQNKHKVGVAGKNGSGKTTLFKLILGELSPDMGELSLSNNLRIASVDQAMPDSTLTALEFVVSGDRALVELEHALTAAEAEEDFEKIVDIHGKLADIDGYTARARAGKLLSGLGFSNDDQSKPVNSFSGGWRMRLSLAKTLMSPAEVLLLDEPTNHLDMGAMIWLERWLQSFNGTLLVISHDREFLDNVVDHMVHVHHHKLTLYNGNYSSFESQWSEHMAYQEAAFQKQQAHIKHMMKYVDRFRYKSSKARQAQSRLKAIERLPVIDRVQQDSQFHFEFFPPSHGSNPLIRLTKAEIGYEDKQIFRHLNLQINLEQRIGLVGPNGAGKSTLIKAILGEMPLQYGERLVNGKTKIGYFAQNQLDHLTPANTALWHMQDLAPEASQQELRNYLGRFGFGNDLAMSAISTFSGGEKARLVLAMLIWQRPALLLLDEPTNHLDMDMRNALLLALQNFQGALVIVSHDRYLLRMTTNELWLVNGGDVEEFAGDIVDYQRWFMQNS
ncbi:MAG: ABC transporter ATP-binding protein [Legionellales bacterium]|nr:ABC transporter ATP-binding protein [Legionellales bacterium]|tara:strand:- start:25894 stop:27465 length:1572 start_codon:yes stop_codon:yes gene_type:complete